MIAEYHLTSASQGTHHILPVLPEGAAWLMPPVDEYLPGSFDGCRDVRVTDRAQILCKVLFTSSANSLKLVFSFSYAGSRLHLLSEGCACFGECL